MGPYRSVGDSTGGTIWDHRGPYGTILDHTGPYRTIRDNTGPYLAIWDQTGQYRTIGDLTWPYSTLRDHTVPYWTIRDHIQLFQALSNFFVSDSLTDSQVWFLEGHTPLKKGNAKRVAKYYCYSFRREGDKLRWADKWLRYIFTTPDKTCRCVPDHLYLLNRSMPNISHTKLILLAGGSYDCLSCGTFLGSQYSLTGGSLGHNIKVITVGTGG